ncbi:MAG TPA: hypothetical protein VLH56_09875 [Dissulfurispiraceae bacterium]|nr:hypothetical protein [Dissulfurispiraceae bacterium]
MKKNISVEEPRFSEESQQRLDDLFLLGGDGWDWQGLAAAFASRHGPFSMGIFIRALISELDKELLD